VTASRGPEPRPDGEAPPELPPRPFPGERPLGSDEPSAPFAGPPRDIPVEPGTGAEDSAAEPGIRAGTHVP
jgi:hypothetical protein